MNHVVSALPVMFRLSIATMIQYRAEVALWALWGIVSPAVLMAVWTAAAHGSATPGQVGGLSVGQLLAYFYMTMIVGHLTTAWDVYEMGWLVRTGALSARLLKPILPIWESLADNVAYKLVTLALLAPIWLLLAVLVRPDFQAGAFDWLLAPVAVGLAGLVAFVWGYVIATLAFFVTKMDSFSELYFGLGMFLGGRFVPISLLPGPLRWLSAALPFRWMYAYPSELLAGQLSREAALIGLLCQAAWLAAGIAALGFCWRTGLKRYSAVGA